jgi:hypothetical protein
MSEATTTLESTPDEAVLMLKARELDIRLKELEIESKEYNQKNRPSLFKTGLTNPAVIAAAIAA